MDDRLTACARADDTHFSFENKRDSLGSIPSGPEKLPGRKALLNRLLEERVPSRRSEAFKKLVLCGGLSQTFAAVETGELAKIVGSRNFCCGRLRPTAGGWAAALRRAARSEEHTSELQSLRHLVCRLLLEKK